MYYSIVCMKLLKWSNNYVDFLAKLAKA